MSVQAAINGGRSKSEHKNTPVSTSEIVTDVMQVARAGASSVHLHPRDLFQRETFDPEVVRSILCGIRASVDIPIGFSTGEWIDPSPDRMNKIALWAEQPDFASVNIHEEQAVKMISLLTEKGIAIEAGIWTEESAEKFIHLGLADRCTRILIELMEPTLDEAISAYRRITTLLRDNHIQLPILVHGQETTAWPLVKLAVEEGQSTRIGIEDTLLLPDKQLAETNAQMVRIADEYFRQK